ncbi:MAG TPA: polysaccharide biosynthesis C-terminal domain-containing protein [Bacteroidales bacterium]|nr:polysaccharide biosynthesis C-terminal domain-containing protein [Bacteroidales bacterium]
MYLLNTIKTLLSRSGILGLNFLLVIITSRLWGAEGRGIISILMADLAIIVVINNVFTGSSVAFYTPAVNFQKLMKSAYVWVFAFSIAGALFFSLFLGHANFLYLAVLTVITSLSTFNLSVLIGKEKLSLYNLYSLLLPLLTLVLIIASKYLFPSASVYMYFGAYGIAYGLIWLLGLIHLKPSSALRQAFDLSLAKKIFTYGYKNELSYFLQFLNYRLSYFILLYYMGLNKVGLFSLGIAVAESVWILSKSLSLVLYSKLINTKDAESTKGQTNLMALISGVGTLLIGLVVIFIPEAWFVKVFGPDFATAKSIVLWLYPGILFVAVANIYGHYMAATNQMRPLILKSAFGLVVTVVFSYYLIPSYGIVGACITTTCSHVVSSVYIFWAIKFRESV